MSCSEENSALMVRKRALSITGLPPTKRQAVESWIRNSQADGRSPPLQATRKRKIDGIHNESSTVCQYPRKRHHSAAPLTRQALIQLALPSTQSTKPEQLLDDDLPSPADMSSQATASEDQSQIPTPSTITPDLPAFEHELRRRKVLDADAEEISEQFPDNWAEIQKVLRQDRESPEPTTSEHKGFRRRVINTGNEAAVMASVCPKFLKEQWYDEPGVAWQHDQPWRKYVPLCPHMTPKLPPPKPDQAIGWTPNMFDKFNAAVLLTSAPPLGQKSARSFAAPNDNLHWPVFTVEGKGAAGQLRKARRQNLHNGSIMVNNFLELKKKVNATTLSFGRAMVMSMELTAEIVQLNCHWAARSINGDVTYYGRTLGSWSLHCPRQSTFREAKRWISNGVEWVRKNAYDDLLQDLSRLEKLSTSIIQTPPDSQRRQDCASSTASTHHSSSSSLSLACEQVSISESERRVEDDPSKSRRRKKTPSMQENPREKVSCP
jgi:hypothetical protein